MESPGGLTPVARRSIVTDTREQLTSLITSGSLKPGQKLPSERELIAALEVSRPTCARRSRRSWRWDPRGGQGAGTYVSDLDPARLAEPLVLIVDLNATVVNELFDVRRMLETGAIQLAAPTYRGHGSGRDGGDHDRRCGRDRRRRSVHDRDIAFHRVIHRASGNTLLIALLESVARLARGSRMLTGGRRSVRELALADHRTIMAALRSHDAAAAGAAMLAHLEHMREALDQAAGE